MYFVFNAGLFIPAASILVFVLSAIVENKTKKSISHYIITVTVAFP
ncbi:hypothetical protein [Sutcliffiella deserti]|nr:hypothetical protein [Sutcliffiella deserti]